MWRQILKAELASKTGFAQLDFDNVVIEDEDCCEELWKELKQIVSKHRIVLNVFTDYAAAGFVIAPLSKYDFEETFEDWFAKKPCELIEAVLRAIPFSTFRPENWNYSAGDKMMRNYIHPFYLKGEKEWVTGLGGSEINKWMNYKIAAADDLEVFQEKTKSCQQIRQSETITPDWISDIERGT